MFNSEFYFQVDQGYGQLAGQLLALSTLKVFMRILIGIRHDHKDVLTAHRYLVHKETDASRRGTLVSLVILRVIDVGAG